MRERFQAEGVKIDSNYFAMGADSEQRLNAFAEQQYGAVAEAIYQGRNLCSRGRQGVIDALWGAQDMRKLNELAQLFQLPADSAAESFFAWKGVVYLQFEKGEKNGVLGELQKWLETERRVAEASMMDPAAKRALNELVSAFSTMASELEKRMVRYRTAFDGMFVQRNDHQAFSAFLADASSYFQSIGISVAKLGHLSDVWQRTLKRRSAKLLNTKDKSDLVRNMLGQMAA
ncbi:hypothetical protein [Roseiterribacter gracilis]|uniref:Uncharacterized protein n=1 Tax=Roseiterribacter gracilis TaxID=2812848 RepID=A0A8S8XCR4_9PROT|nr:hypothetical protein TMPK1_13120 [Rhodospirillales bacterium TMPK1]